MMSRKHSTSLSQNGEREVVPEAQPRPTTFRKFVLSVCVQRTISSRHVTPRRPPRGDVYIYSRSFLTQDSRKTSRMRGSSFGSASTRQQIFIAPPRSSTRARMAGVFSLCASLSLSLFRRVIFHRLSTPGQTRFLGTKSRNPIARAFHRRGIKRAEPSASALRSHGDTKSTKSSCHAPFESRLIHGPTAPSRLGFTRRRFELCSRHSPRDLRAAARKLRVYRDTFYSSNKRNSSTKRLSV